MVTAVELSQNRKVGEVSATYATQQTCPSTCKLKGNGCYAENGLTAFTTNRLNRQAAAADLDVDTIAQFEANAIDKLSGKLPLRLHVVGDCTTDKGASILSAAAARHTAKHGQKVWSYTHAWRSVSRSSWAGVSVLASCESTKDVKAAQRKGYATALVVAEFKDTKAYKLGREHIKVIPCPVQTGKAESCADCKLCMKDLKGLTIAFRPDGNTGKRVKAALTQITL